MRKGPAGDILLEVASLFHQLVQSITGGVHDDWGYAPRPIRGSTQTSNHASGTAIDLNATRWSLGQPASHNLNADQIAKVHEILAVAGHAVRWGGDYSGRTDPMHFEANTDEAGCARGLAALRAHYSANPTPPPTIIVTPEEIAMEIQLSYFDDAGSPDPAGLNFRASIPVEVGGNSAVVRAAWVRWACYWGTMSGVRVVFWPHAREVSGGAPMGEAPDTMKNDNVAVPEGARGLTVEGRRSDSGAQPSFALLALSH